jgi:hypothetical protein
MVQFNNLIKMLFLMLHWHNITFSSRNCRVSHVLQQFASHAYCGHMGSVFKMASHQEKVFCVLRFEVSRSVIIVQRKFRARFKKNALFLCGASFLNRERY